MEVKKNIEQIANDDGRYKPDAIQFVYEGLGFTVRRQAQQDVGPKHVKGQELSRGIGDLATKKWGRLAKVVLNHWCIYRTRDFGEIVYLMIENKWMSAQPEDRVEDFDDVYDFEQFFEKDFKLEIVSKN